MSSYTAPEIDSVPLEKSPSASNSDSYDDEKGVLHGTNVSHDIADLGMETMDDHDVYAQCFLLRSSTNISQHQAIPSRSR